MSKFRSRQLDASKPIPIFFQEDISDTSEFNNVTNRSVPQLPTGMEKEEETEHHLQQAIFHHRVIPVPEVYSAQLQDGKISYNQLYPENFKPPRQMVHIHPFSADQDIPDYDLDTEDEEWLEEYTRKGELLPLVPSQFEEMMDRLEKASGLKAITLQEAKLLLKDDDDLITAVYDYWLNKRLTLQHPLIPQVKSEKGIGGAPTDPYVAFRKRTEKMQTRKNRKNDESSYEKMLKLRRDLARAVSLLDMMKKREKAKRELLHLNVQIHEKRYDMEDFSGTILNELLSQRLHHQPPPSAFAPLIPNHQLSGISFSELDDYDADTLGSGAWLKIPAAGRQKNKRRDDGRRERRPYKKKKRNQHLSSTPGSHLSRAYTPHPSDPYSLSSIYHHQGGLGIDEEVASFSEAEDESLDGYFAFRRNTLVTYLPPKSSPICDDEDPRHQFFRTSLRHPTDRFIGFARRRVGRGGRILLDRISSPYSDPNAKSDIPDTGQSSGVNPAANSSTQPIQKEWRHFHPSVTVDSSEDSEDADVDVETVCGGGLSSLVPSSASSATGDVSSSFYITAEVLEGTHEGALTNLRVTLPDEDLDFLTPTNSSILLEGNNLVEDIDFLSDPISVCSNKITDAAVVSSSQSETVSSRVNNSDCTSNFDNSESCLKECRETGNSGSCLKSAVGRKNLSMVNSSLQKHSILDFQTQPSSKFSTLDTNVMSTGVHPHSNKLSQSLDGISSSLSNCTSSSRSSSNNSSSCVKYSSSSSLDVTTTSSSSPTTSSSILSSLPTPSSKAVSSSSLATSLSSLLCASSQKKNCENSRQEVNNKKLLNLSSIYIRKDTSDSASGGGGGLFNRNNVLSNSSSNSLVSQKYLSSWTSEALSNSDDGASALTNGPGSKTLDNLKCTKVAPILFHET